MLPRRHRARNLLVGASAGLLASVAWLIPIGAADVGREVAVPHHLQDGDEFRVSLQTLLSHGRRLFDAVWTPQEGGGRPLTKGTGAPLADGTDPLVFPRNFNRVSAPDANACSGCHNRPFGLSGGGGDIVANVFVLGQRFDFLTFDNSDATPTRGAADEAGNFVTLQGAANSRATLGMFGSGYIEMLARQITADLQAIRDTTPPGGARALQSKGISYGTISRAADGTWNTSGVEGIAAPSLATSGPAGPPSLIIRPFHQAGNVVSLRQFTNNAFNHHHGIQSTERFGIGTDPDGDGFTNEMTRADVTAAAIFQATMAVPGRVIPTDPELEAAVWRGEQRFKDAGCASCHIPELPLDEHGWVFTEPNPYNPAGNLRVGEAPTLSVDLSRPDLPSPRLRPTNGVVWVPAFTDLKLHDITSGPADPNRETLDMNQPAGSPGFFAGNGKFLTRKLWGTANEPPYYHHGQYTTLRQAVLAHAGEAEASAQAYAALSGADQDAVIEFLKSLQVLPPGTRSRVIDDRGRPRSWHTNAHSGPE
jgi:cytochrome c peroxidase